MIGVAGRLTPRVSHASTSAQSDGFNDSDGSMFSITSVISMRRDVPIPAAPTVDPR